MLSNVTELLANVGIFLMMSGMGKVKQSSLMAALVPSNTLEPTSFRRQQKTSSVSSVALGTTVLSCST